MVLLPTKEGETAESLGGYLAPLRQALLDNNSGHVNVVVCKSDYHALKRGIQYLPSPPDHGDVRPATMCRRRNLVSSRSSPRKPGARSS